MAAAVPCACAHSNNDFFWQEDECPDTRVRGADVDGLIMRAGIAVHGPLGFCLRVKIIDLFVASAGGRL